MNATLRRIVVLVPPALLAMASACDSQRPSEPILSGIAVDSNGAPVAGARIGIMYRFGSPMSAAPAKSAEDPVPVLPPQRDELHQNMPNPFDRATRLVVE